MGKPTRLEILMDNVKINPGTGCWEWTGAISSKGYGSIWFKGGMKSAHRVFYWLIKGPILDDLQLDHLCRIRHCVNPDHLEPVTNQENCQRGNTGKHNSNKTHCPSGHEYNSLNTYIDSRGWRNCLKCRDQRNRKRE